MHFVYGVILYVYCTFSIIIIIMGTDRTLSDQSAADKLQIFQQIEIAAVSAVDLYQHEYSRRLGLTLMASVNLNFTTQFAARQIGALLHYPCG